MASVPKEVAFATPAGYMIWRWLEGLSMSDLTAGAGFVLICMQIGYLFWKWRREAKGKQNEPR